MEEIYELIKEDRLITKCVPHGQSLGGATIQLCERNVLLYMVYTTVISLAYDLWWMGTDENSCVTIILYITHSSGNVQRKATYSLHIWILALVIRLMTHLVWQLYDGCGNEDGNLITYRKIWAWYSYNDNCKGVLFISNWIFWLSSDDMV